MLNNLKPRHSVVDFIPILVGSALAAAIVLGGGGSGWPLPESALQCVMAVFGFAWVWLLTLENAPRPSRQAMVLAAMIVALPVAQLIPLPPIIWHNMPGREVEFAALQLIGRESSWQPWSLTPNLTLAALLAMAPAALILLAVSTLDRAGRNLVLRVIVGVALLSVCFGAGQLSGDKGSVFRIYIEDSSYLNGFQSHHNHQADILMVAMVALAVVAREYGAKRGSGVNLRYFLGFVGGTSALLALGVILTASRSGMLMLPVPIIAQAWLLRRWLHLGRRQVILALLGLGFFAIILMIFLANNAVLSRVFGRFNTPTEFRPEIWQDTIFAIRQYLPWGSGLGSFIPIFTSIERLEVVSDLLTNRAHNDYLEFLLEAGIPGAIMFLTFVSQIGLSAWRGMRIPPAGSRVQVIGAVIILVIIGLHSLIDYPLRSMSLAAIAAASVGLLIPSARIGADRSGNQVPNTVRDER